MGVFSLFFAILKGGKEEYELNERLGQLNKSLANQTLQLTSIKL